MILSLPPRYQDPVLLGEGGMGTVYRATDRDLGRPVALKVIRADRSTQLALRQRLEREIHLLAALDHPGVVRVYDAGEWDGFPYYSMELIEGETLLALVRRGGDDPRRLVELLVQLADALEAVHAAGILHRDLKPHNVMVARDGSLRLMDFGLAKSAESDATALTRTGNLVGTLGYVAPETLGGAPWDARGDVYGLGAVAYFTLTGRLPLKAEELVQAVLRHEHPVAPPPSALNPAVPPALDPLIMAACAFDREDRSPSAAAVRYGLRAWLRDVEPPSATLPPRSRPARARPATQPATLPPRPRAAERRRAVPAVWLAVLALVAAVSFWPPTPEEPEPAVSGALELASLRSLLLDEPGAPDPTGLARLGDAAAREGLLARLGLPADVPPATGGAYYLTRFAVARGRQARAVELYAWLLEQPAGAPAPLSSAALLEAATAAARAAGRFEPLEAALDRAAEAPRAPPEARRAAFDLRLTAWHAGERAIGLDFDAVMQARPDVLRGQEARLLRALNLIRPLEAGPSPAAEDVGRLLRGLALRGNEECLREFLAVCERRLTAPTAAPWLLARAGDLLAHGWDADAAMLARARRWLERAVPGHTDPEALARSLERLAAITIRMPAGGTEVRADDPKLAEALVVLDRAQALRPSPGTRAALAATRAQVLLKQERPADAASVLDAVPEADVDPERRWWTLRVRADVLADTGRTAEAPAVIRAAFACCPPEVRHYLAPLIQGMIFMDLMRKGAGGPR